MAEVTLEHVGKFFPNGVTAVHDLNLNISSGELIAVVGPSGSGKTTTLRLIAGLEEPSSGTVRIGGQVVNHLPPHRRNVALVFQRPVLYPHLTVRDNLAFSLRLTRRRRWLAGLLGGRRRRAEALQETQHVAGRVTEVARLLHLEELLERRPDQLSGGQQQRVALGRALVRGPAVFLLDEPLGNLEFRLRLEMRRELHLLQRRLRATMIHVTHDAGEALALGDRVVVLDRGQVQQVGSPRAVVERPANRLVADLVHWPPLNFVDGQVLGESGQLWFVAPPWRWPLPPPREAWGPCLGKCVTLGFRPEDVQVVGGEENRLFSPPATMMMEVALIEFQGISRLVTLRQGGRQLTAQVPDGLDLQPGQTLIAALNISQAHWFDQRTGQRLKD
jgi:multiple sugar transport system ATP-binding protein